MTEKASSGDPVRPGDHLESYTVTRKRRVAVYENLVCIETGEKDGGWIRFLLMDTPGATLRVEL